MIATPERGPRDIQERAFDFACRIVRLHQHLAKSRGTSRTLAGQLLRSGTSIAANLEEASTGQSKADFVSKCSIALKEARETHYWLRLRVATNLLTPGQTTALLEAANTLVAILTSIVKKASTCSNRGKR